MIAQVQAKVRGQGQYYSDGREILFVEVKKSECATIEAANGVRRPIRLRIGRDLYQAGIRTTARMPTVWLCSNLVDDHGEKVSLAEALTDAGFFKNQPIILSVQKDLIEVVTAQSA